MGTFISKALLPSISLIPSNPAVVNELWEILRLYPYQERYKFYSRWKDSSYAKYPELVVAKAEAANEVRKIMRSDQPSVLLGFIFF